MSTSVPNLHVSSLSKVKGRGSIFIQSRKDAVHSGKFTVEVSVSFDPGADVYPGGSLLIKTDLSDATDATYKATSIELINSFGKHNPTVIFTGRCDVQLSTHGEPPKGCKYWILIANNKKTQEQGTPDIVSFVVTDRTGNRIAYGTGPLESGDFDVVSSS